MRFRTLLQYALALLIMGAALVSLWQLLTTIALADLEAALRATTAAKIGLSLGAVVISFGCLALYEYFAADTVAPGRIPVQRALGVGAIAHAIANTVGFHVLVASAIRYQGYTRNGVTVVEIGRIVVLVGVFVGLGSVTTLCLTFLLAPAPLPWMQPVGLLLAAVLTAMILFLPVLSQWRHIHLPRLTRGRLLGLLPLGTLEMMAALFALFILLPDNGRLDFWHFVPAFVLAMVLGILSHSPGGLGVFEATLALTLPGGQTAAVLAALLLYRLLYNVLPFLLALTALAIWPLRPWKYRRQPRP